MPIYTFKCKKCGNIFDELVRSHDVKELTCKCSPTAIAERTVSTPSKAKFNGSGFYETDYKK